MRTHIVVGLTCLIIGVVLCRIYYPVDSTIVEVYKEKSQNDVKTIIKEIIRPDGSKEIITDITDKSSTNKDKTSTKIIAKNDWHISASGSRTFTDSSMTYSLQVERRVIGDVFLGATVNTEKQVGLTVGIDW